MLQVHLSGGEPASRPDLVALVGGAAKAGLYTNLITSGVGLDRARLDGLAAAGLDHVQLSVQDVREDEADRIAGYRGAHAKKRAFAREVAAAGLPLTINAVIHRANIDAVEALVAEAVTLGARRIEIAHAQYYGWALKNRAALMPTAAQAAAARASVERLREELRGAIVIDYVAADHFGRFPKPCMSGWGRRSLNVTPAGRVLPCHAAETIPGLSFWNVQDRPLKEIWEQSPAFNAFRGTDWMREPCASCDRKRDRFRRLPLPGAGAHRRRGEHRPGLRLLAGPGTRRGGGRGGARRSGRPRLSPLPAAACGLGSIKPEPLDRAGRPEPPALVRRSRRKPRPRPSPRADRGQRSSGRVGAGAHRLAVVCGLGARRRGVALARRRPCAPRAARPRRRHAARPGPRPSRRPGLVRPRPAPGELARRHADALVAARRRADRRHDRRVAAAPRAGSRRALGRAPVAARPGLAAAAVRRPDRQPARRRPRGRADDPRGRARRAARAALRAGPDRSPQRPDGAVDGARRGARLLSRAGPPPTRPARRARCRSPSGSRRCPTSRSAASP